MEPSKTSKLPPDDRKVGRRNSATNNFSDTQSSQRQATPIPNGSKLTSGQIAVSQILRPRRKLTEEPIDSISIKSLKGNHVTRKIATTESTYITGSNGVNTTPIGNSGSEHCADNTSPSLWLRKTPEEILDYYKRLGPDWRNEFEKTDLTYSPSSPWYNKEVVEGSGIPVIPNMSREPVGLYARNMKNRKKTAEDLNSYSVEVGRTGDYYLSNDRRATLAYGLSHSPSFHHTTPTSRPPYPSHAYPQNSRHLSSNYSSSSSRFSASISRTRHVISSTVTMVTKLFTLVWSVLSLAWLRRRQSSQESEGVDTVDHANQHHQHQSVQTFDYKTKVRKSNVHHPRSSSGVASSRSYLSTSYHLISFTVYSFTTWLIQTNVRILGIKDRCVGTALPGRVRNCVKYGLLAIALALFGFYLFSPLNYPDSVNSTESHLPSSSDLKSPWTYLNTPISATVHLFQTREKKSREAPLFDTAHLFKTTVSYLITPISATAQLFKTTVYHLTTPISMAAQLFETREKKLQETSTSASPQFFEAREKKLQETLISDAAQLFESREKKLQETLISNAAQVFETREKKLQETLISDAAQLFESREKKLQETLISDAAQLFESREKKLQETLISDAAQLFESREKKLQENLISEAAQLFESREKKFHETLISNTAQVFETREKELLEKVTELCSRLVESEIIKFKSSVVKEQETQQRLQQTIPAPVSMADNEEILRYKAQVEDMITQIKSLETEQQTSFLDLMTKFSGLMDDKIRTAFAVYDADRTGLTDYAMESAGGAVVNIRCTETYTLKDPYYVLFGFALWKRDSSPRKAIQPGLLPGDCWAFKGAVGCLVLKLSHRIKITKFSMEHIPRALTPSGEIDSAPNKFTVWGLTENFDNKPTFLGEFAYDNEGPTLQYFDALDTSEAFDMVELKIASNHGNIEYTCLYRFRVHGSLTPPSSAPDYQIPHNMAANQNTYHHHSPADVKYNPV